MKLNRILYLRSHAVLHSFIHTYNKMYNFICLFYHHPTVVHCRPAKQWVWNAVPLEAGLL